MKNKRTPVRAIHVQHVRASQPVLRPMALGVMFALSGGAFANPTGPSVAAGAASFQSAGNTLSVTNAPGTIINWQSFSIGNGEHTRFLQQSASSAVLNRVVGADASSILGSLSSNGRVFLVNPHGIIFGAGARIDTAGFIASTLNMADRDFLDGRLRFDGGGNGLLRNEGEIRASGDIMLVGPTIENAGLIRSGTGSVLLAAGKSVTITSPDAQGVKFEVQAPTDSAVNLGTIEASSAAAMFAGTLVHSGDIRAQTASLDGGRVVLSAQKEAIVQSGGVISASGGKGGEITVRSGDLTSVAGKIEAKSSASEGGSVRLLGNRVAVQSGASVDASGEAGGGTVLVGGDYQGKNTDVQNAWRTYVAPNSTLRADAIVTGDGGKVIVWADDSTRFHGEISARGGASSGDGGFVETSGKSLDIARARVDTRAPAGETGTWLLDPVNVQVQALGASSTLEDVNQFGDPGLLVIIDPATINAAASNVIIQAHNDIDFNDPVSMSGLGVGLTAEAGNSIRVKANISTNNGEIRLLANQPQVSGVDPLFRVPGAAELAMDPGTVVNAGSANAFLRIGNGLGHDGTSGDIRLANVVADNISILHEGPTANSSIVRSDAAALLTASTSIDFSHTPAGAGGSIGKSGAPIRVSTQRLEAHLTQAAGGIFIDSPNAGDLQIGDAVLLTGGFRGVQAMAGGPVQLSVNGNVTRAAGSAPCGGGAGAGGPICAVGVDGDVTLAAAALGAPGAAGRLHVDVNGGTIAATTTTGGIFLEQRNGDALLSNYALILPDGQSIELGTGNGRFTMDTSIATSLRPFTLFSGGLGGEISFSGGIFVAAPSLLLEGSGPAVFNSGTVDLNTPVVATVPVNIGGATVNFNGAASLSAPLALSAGVLGGAGAVSANGGLLLTGGAISGTGGVTVAGGTTLGGGTFVLNGALTTDSFNSTAAVLSLTPPGVLTLNGAPDSVFTGGTINNSGTVNLAGSGALVLNSGAVWNNTGNFVFQSDADVRNDVGAATFANTASVSKSGAAGTSQIGSGALTFTNTAGGTIDVFSGTLAFAPASFMTNEAAINVFSGTLSTGDLTNAAGGNINIFTGATLATGNLTNAAGATLGGAGALTLAALGTPRTLTNFGTVDPGLSLGAPGTLTVDGNFTQGLGGTLVIDITTTAPGSFDVLAVSGHAALDGTLNVNHANGFIPPSDANFNVITYGSRSGDFASMNVPAGYASFYAGAPGLNTYTLSIGDIVNAWTAGASGAWESAGNWSLNHTPTAGEDVLIDVAGETSTITISAGNQFARRVTSNENLTLSGGEIVFGPLASVVNATFSVSGANVTLTGELAANSIELSGGSLDVRNSTGSLPRLAMTGGTLMSPGTLTVNGPFSASGGMIAPGDGLGALFVTAGASVITTANPTEPLTTQRDWSNTGTLTLGGELRLSSANFTNATGGTLSVNTAALMNLQTASLTNNGTLNFNTGDETPFGTMPGGGSIVNTGVLNKNAPDVVAGADFVNLVHTLSNATGGRINVNAGTLSAAFGGTQSGQIEIAQGATLNTDGALVNAAGGVVGGRGTINLFGGALTNSGSVRPGLIGSGGTLTIDGDFTNAPDGIFDLRLGGQAPTQFGSLNVTGTANLGGTLALAALPGYAAPEGDTFRFLTAAAIVNDFAPVTPTFASGEYFLKQPTSHFLGLGGPNTNSWISDVNGAWDNTSNWSRQTVPNSPDARAFITRPADIQVTIPAGAFAVDTLQSRETVILDGTLALASPSSVNGVLQINATGALQGAGSMTLTDLTFSGALANTGGVTVVDSVSLTGNPSIASGGRLTAQNDFLMLGGGTLNVAAGGSLILTGGGDKRLGGGAVISNAGTTSLSGASLVGAGTLQNEGTFNSATPGANVLGTVFNNAGTVDLDGGTLRLTGGGTDIGTYAIDAGTTLDFAGGTRVLQGALALNGAGAIQLSGGTLDVQTGALPKLDITGGTLTRSTAGDLTIAGAFNVSGGSVAPGADLLITNGITTVAQSIGVSRSWTNNGTLSTTGAGQINPSPGAGHQFVNEGTLNIAGDNPNPFGTAPDASVVNRGTLNKSATAVADLVSAFSNTGVVNVDGGTLRLSGSGTDTGSYSVDAGTTLQLAAGIRNLNAGSNVSGAGAVVLSGGTANVNAGYSVSATRISGASASFNGAAGQSTNNLSFVAGSLGGTGTLTVNTAGTWLGGELTGPATLSVANGAKLDLTSDTSKLVNGAIVANAGTVNLSGTGGLVLNNGATFNNAGLFDVQSDAGVQNTAGAATFANTGTLRKSGGVGTTMLGTNPTFALTSVVGSTIDVQTGTLQVTGAFSASSGTLNVESGATFSTGGAALANAGTLRGAGTIDLAGATLTNNSVIAPGTASDNTGTLTIGGNLVQGAGGSVSIELGGTAPGQFDALGVSGSAALDGTLNLTTTGVYAPASGDTFSIVSAATRTGTFATTTKSFANEVIPTYGATSLSLMLGSTTGNTWIFDVSDSWTSAQRWSQGRAPIATDQVVINRPAGEFTITVPAGSFSVDKLTSSENLTLNGTLALATASSIDATLAVNGGTLQGSGPLTVGTLMLDGATLAGAGGVTVTGSTGVAGGASQLTGSLTTDAFSMTGGSLNTGAGSILNLVGAQPKTISGGTLTTAGTTNLSGSADTTLTGGALWDNSGTINLGGATRVVLAGDGAATLVNRGTGAINDTSTNATPITVGAATRTGKSFMNAGRYTKAAGSADVQTLDVPMTNTGTIEVLLGTLVANGFPANSGIVDIRSGATFSTAGLPLTNSLFGLLKGDGMLMLAGATFTNNGTVAPGASPGTLTIDGNYVQGPGGTLAIELGGSVPGTDYDLLKVSGTAALDGTLVVTRSPGTTITEGSAYEFMTYASATGDFSGYSVPQGFAFQTARGATSYTLTNSVAAPPEQVMEAIAVTQNEAVVFNERVVVTQTADNTDPDAERRTLQECR